MKRVSVLGLAALTATLMVAGCGGASDDTGGAQTSADGSGGNVSLVAYSTPQVVYDQVIPAFNATAEGKGVSVATSFGASGDQSRAVAAGLDADVVSFSVEPDMKRLVKAGLVADDWKSGENKGLVNTSVVAFVVREGNPKNIRTWDDLLKPGIEVITPNPFTSGAAKWNLLGAYAYGGEDFVRKLIHDHVKVQPKSGREALQTFTSGKGDVLLSYEYEAITARKKGEKVDYVLPDKTIRIDIDIATTKKAGEPAKKFLDFILGDKAQQYFADWGYRPINQTVLKANAASFPQPKELKTIEDFGGWDKVDPELFDPTDGIVAKIEEDAGVSTAK